MRLVASHESAPVTVSEEMRAVADAIDAGHFGSVTRVLLVLDSHDAIDTTILGAASSLERLGMLEYARAAIINGQG